DQTALALDDVAAPTLAFAPEDLLAVRDIARRRHIDGRAAQPMNVRGHLPNVRIRQLTAERRYLRAGNAVFDRVEDLRVGALRIATRRHAQGRSHLAGRAVGPMAGGARLVVDGAAFVNRLQVAGERIRGARGRAAA